MPEKPRILVVEDEKLGLESGGDAYLRKPFQTKELLGAIEKLMSK